MKINWKILVICVSIPVMFSLLCQIGELIELIFPQVTVFVNITTFATILLVFLISVIICIFVPLTWLEGFLTGTFIGFLAETCSLFFIILLSVIMQAFFTHNFATILTWDFICDYIVPNLIFVSFNGAIGGIIGVKLNKSIKNKNSD
ncbi:hypothetical protein [Methanobacterium alcaliphilum]|uniref:hypothetical protein n=1 Tax=Methanobacterium alcaliphilum TaxID=392018 RepID=UPI00200A7F7D|nr:hypothetical protein [Methanobacterium alcaliphilum]MCK9152574.1 hypothetical protein [Methanobacterium alcaliphilum]